VTIGSDQADRIREEGNAIAYQVILLL